MEPADKNLQEILDKILKTAGPSVKQVVYEDLERAGFRLDSAQFALDELEKILERSFGPDATLLLMNSIQKQLKER